MGTWTLAPLAQQDLGAINDQIAQHSPQAAARYVEAIIKGFDLLATFPELGPRCEDVAMELRWFKVRKHVIYYKTRGNGVVIRRILHGSQDIPTALNE